MRGDAAADRGGPGIPRRAILRAGGWLPFGILLGRRGAGAAPPLAAGRKTRVVLVRHPDVIDRDGRPRPEVAGRMLDEAVSALLGVEDAAEAWSRLVQPSDVVGIKSNEWRYLPTPAAVEGAIRERVVGAGVREDSVAVEDRRVLGHAVFERATALVNVRPMRTHWWAGLGTCIKNYIMFVPEPRKYHPNGCEDLGGIWSLPHVRGKTRLNVLVLFTPLFHGSGPHHFNRAYTWPYAGMLVGREPVPVDTVGAAILAAKRRAFFGEERPIRPEPRHIEVAGARHGLGAWRMEEIDLVRLGEGEGALV